MIETLQLSEEFSVARPGSGSTSTARSRSTHVLDDMDFLDYRLADVRIAPEVTLDRARHRLAPGRRAVGSPTTAGG